jgi:hypothetical protein
MKSIGSQNTIATAAQSTARYREVGCRVLISTTVRGGGYVLLHLVDEVHGSEDVKLRDG